MIIPRIKLKMKRTTTKDANLKEKEVRKWEEKRIVVQNKYKLKINLNIVIIFINIINTYQITGKHSHNNKRGRKGSRG